MAEEIVREIIRISGLNPGSLSRADIPILNQAARRLIRERRYPKRLVDEAMRVIRRRTG